MDKTGRFQLFDKEGNFKGILAEIDAYLSNGFTINNDEAIIACSGIVQPPEGGTICDDWLERIKLDGTKWNNEAK